VGLFGCLLRVILRQDERTGLIGIRPLKLRGKVAAFSLVLLGVIFLSNSYAILSLYHLHVILVSLKDTSVRGLLTVSKLQHQIGMALPDEKRFLFFSPMPPTERPSVEKDLSLGRVLLFGLAPPSPQARVLLNESLKDIASYQSVIDREWAALISGHRDQAIRISQTESSPILIHLASLLKGLRAEFSLDLENKITQTTQEQSQMTTISIELLSVGIFLVMLLLWSFSNIILSPLMILIEGTRKISGGIFHNPVTVPNQDELGDLARALNEMAGRLGEVNRLKSEFVTIASHELRTPLTSIRGFLQMLQRGQLGPLNPDQEKSLAIVREEVDHLVELVNGLLDLGRIESGQISLEIQEVVLPNLLERLSERQSLACNEAGKNFETHFDPDLPVRIRTDPGKLTQVLENLLGNAFKFTPSGGTISLWVTRSVNSLEIEVRDTGIGIPIEHIPQLFDKFYQVTPFNTRVREGLGLGLAITRGIILTMGGAINVRQNEPKGTVFHVAFPFEPVIQEKEGQDE
jgi:signal transduction histidine kinase